MKRSFWGDLGSFVCAGDESLKRVGFARCGGFLGKARGKKKDLSVGIGLFRFGGSGNRAIRRDVGRVRLRDAWLVRLQVGRRLHYDG